MPMRIAKRLVATSYLLALPLGCLGLMSGCDSGVKDGGQVEAKVAPLTPDQQKAKDSYYNTKNPPKPQK